MEEFAEHRIRIERAARYYTLGDSARTPQELWYVIHGYAQLAARFLRRFRPLDDGTQLVVAPEALSRFYIERPGRTHAETPVGASWMTREDRFSEIDDYVAYLDALDSEIRSALDGAVPRVTVLGFSQGAATAARWVERGRATTHRLVLWGGLLPPDLDLSTHADAFRGVELIVAAGDADAHVPPAALAEQRERLARHALRAREIAYAGGHEITSAALAEVAANP